MEGKFDFSTPITEDTTLNALWTCSDIDPNNPTLQNLKLALGTGNPSAIYPIGTLFPDTYTQGSGTGTFPFHWRVVHYGTAMSTTGQEITGAYLMADETFVAQRLASSSTYSAWGGAANGVWAILNPPSGGLYTGWFSQTAKDLATPITNKFYDGPSGLGRTSTDTFFVPSLSEVGAVDESLTDSGSWWSWFKREMGGVITTADTPARIVRSRSGTVQWWWLRDRYYTSSGTSGQATCVDSDGEVLATAASGNWYIVPCFFMAS